jgi:HPt (histidine-containing phosphotransfer) domain-containing protein
LYKLLHSSLSPTAGQGVYNRLNLLFSGAACAKFSKRRNRCAMSGAVGRIERIAEARRKFVIRTQQDKDLLLATRERWLAGVKPEPEVIRALTHRLRGTAGSYGFFGTSRAAAALELELDEDPSLSKIDPATKLLILEIEKMRADSPS